VAEEVVEEKKPRGRKSKRVATEEPVEEPAEVTYTNLTIPLVLSRFLFLFFLYPSLLFSLVLSPSLAVFFPLSPFL
jgi:hypothetical protein